MSETRLGVSESHFADIVWELAPVSASELVKICEKEFEWKRSTTYTVLKRLCERGLFNLEDGCVEVLLSRSDFYANQSEKYVEESFGGSLPAFLAAFTSRKKLSDKDVIEIRRLLDGYDV